MISVESCYGQGEDSGFRLADVKVPVLGEVVKIGDNAVETFGRVSDNSHVIGTEEDLDRLEEFVAEMEFAVDGVLDIDLP